MRTWMFVPALNDGKDVRSTVESYYKERHQLERGRRGDDSSRVFEWKVREPLGIKEMDIKSQWRRMMGRDIMNLILGDWPAHFAY